MTASASTTPLRRLIATRAMAVKAELLNMALMVVDIEDLPETGRLGRCGEPGGALVIEGSLFVKSTTFKSSVVAVRVGFVHNISTFSRCMARISAAG